jgi:hypothetical protein
LVDELVELDRHHRVSAEAAMDRLFEHDEIGAGRGCRHDISRVKRVEHSADTLANDGYLGRRKPHCRSVGEVTDVVEKQMYTFDDRDGRSVSLRPEGTASAVRAYIENAQWNKEPVTRWYYMGPMFRHERAQRGRLRQFDQVGAEVFGANGIALAGPDFGTVGPQVRTPHRHLVGAIRPGDPAGGAPATRGYLREVMVTGVVASWRG